MCLKRQINTRQLLLCHEAHEICSSSQTFEHKYSFFIILTFSTFTIMIKSMRKQWSNTRGTGSVQTNACSAHNVHWYTYRFSRQGSEFALSSWNFGLLHVPLQPPYHCESVLNLQRTTRLLSLRQTDRQPYEIHCKRATHVHQALCIHACITVLAVLLQKRTLLTF